VTGTPLGAAHQPRGREWETGTTPGAGFQTTMVHVTDVMPNTAVAPPVGDPAASATWAAAEAARHSGVRITELSDLHSLRAVDTLFDSIWHPAPGNPPVTVELLRALTKAGNYLTGAFAGDQLVGACVGFFAGPAGTTLHSHVTGVVGHAQHRNVGRALKLHQRAWALDRGLTRITWTFDPLIRRNAWFNLGRLAAVPVEYLPDFYGEMADSINGQDESDRLLTAWTLAAEPVVRACAGQPASVDLDQLRAAGAITALCVDAGGRPVVHEHPADGTGPVLVAVPPDIEALRQSDPGLAREWRRALRAVLGGAMDAGAQVRGFHRDGWYVLGPATAPAGTRDPVQ
jgi:predicted GNAT superfamily acetyltransferase